MNREILAGKWHEYKGKVKEKWGKLTDNDLTEINGKREMLLGKLEQRYGYEKDKAERELKHFEDILKSEKDMHKADKGHHQESESRRHQPWDES